jgi:ferrous iron transport protein A
MNLVEAAVKRGHVIEITGFVGDTVYRDRLHEMGFRVGSLISIIGRAPFRGPLLVRYKTSFLALRVEEASCIEVRWRQE